jgi:hypothetical protein
MFRERMRGLTVALLTLAILLIFVAAACTDDGDEPATVPAATPTPDGEEASPTAAANSVIGAVEAYVTETGLDGETFEVTDPINCLAFVELAEEEKPFGRICINFNNSDFGDTSGVMEVWEYGTEATWDLTLELQNLSWVVTAAEPTTPEGDEQ